jgi:hypothetical protein
VTEKMALYLEKKPVVARGFQAVVTASNPPPNAKAALMS